jgi:adenylate cyclase class IV
LVAAGKPPVKTIVGDSSDVYWLPSRPVTADFIRVRYHPAGGGQITVKHEDKKDNLDRVEIDVDVQDPDQAVKMLKAAEGPPVGVLRKKYTVFFVDNDDTNVSVYKVRGDSRVFVEIEAKKEKVVNELVGTVRDGAKYKLRRVASSLFSMFILGRPMSLRG